MSKTRYQQVADDIISKIQRGEFEINKKLPPENELIEEYGFSSGTIKRALSLLASQGYITRIQSVGTLVKQAFPKREIIERGEILSHTKLMAKAKIKLSTMILSKGKIRVSDIISTARMSEIFPPDTDEELIYIRRLRKGDGQPYTIQTAYLFPNQTPGILDLPDAEFMGLFELYKKRFFKEIVRVDEKLRVTPILDGETADTLGIELGDIAITRERISYSNENRIFEISVFTDRPEIYQYHYSISSDTTKALSQNQLNRVE